MARRTLYHICERDTWHDALANGYLGWRRLKGGGPLDCAVAFFTDDPVDHRAWFTNCRREVIIAVSLPDAMVRPFPEFMQFLAAAAGDAKGGQELISLARSPEHVYATPRTIPMRYWRYAQAVDGHMLWMPVAA